MPPFLRGDFRCPLDVDDGAGNASLTVQHVERARVAASEQSSGCVTLRVARSLHKELAIEQDGIAASVVVKPSLHRSRSTLPLPFLNGLPRIRRASARAFRRSRHICLRGWCSPQKGHLLCDCGLRLCDTPELDPRISAISTVSKVADFGPDGFRTSSNRADALPGSPADNRCRSSASQVSLAFVAAPFDQATVPRAQEHPPGHHVCQQGSSTALSETPDTSLPVDLNQRKAA
jgi:hypothetical protein